MNTTAQTLSKQDVVNKFKTLSQGSIGESVLDKMAMTFTALVKMADFKAEQARSKGDADRPVRDEVSEEQPSPEAHQPASHMSGRSRNLGGLHYNIQIILPESRDPKVYDALFRSLHEHLL